MDKKVIVDRDTLFAFSCGIRMALVAHKLGFTEESVIPVLERMSEIVVDPKRSLVKATDNVDWTEFRELRELEKQLCQEYIKECVGESEEK